MKTMYDYLNMIRERNALFGIYIVRDIFQFINGYDLAIKSNKISDPTVDHFFGFADWLRKKEPHLNNFGWLEIIEIYHSPLTSLDGFFVKFDLFLQEVPLLES